MKKRITIIDYGMGNLRSVEKAFKYLGYEVNVCYEKEEILLAEKIVLPGVGAFQKAIENIKNLDLYHVIKQKIIDKTPFLGICLGYQLLYEFSEEGNEKGLNLLKGSVIKFKENNKFKVPHMGWNKILVNERSRLLKGLSGNYFYFVHSYYVNNSNKDIVSSTSYHGLGFDSSIEYENIYATQFHPEKSGDVGLEILDRFGGL
ncbi:imidazole glycerol phosphate synthase subunit HisH [Caldicellulosiruptoraceae bacterium PP1]